VVAALVGERGADRRGPQARDDGQLVLEALEALAERREGDGVGLVLGLVPAGAEAQLDAAAAHLVDLRHRDGERARMAEGGRGHQRAQPDALGVSGQAGQRDVRVGGAREPGDAAHLQVVVRAEEGVEAQLLGQARHGEQIVVRGALLGLGEDPQLHHRAPYAALRFIADGRWRRPPLC
jgi:hypothetical protein